MDQDIVIISGMAWVFTRSSIIEASDVSIGKFFTKDVLRSLVNPIRIQNSVHKHETFLDLKCVEASPVDR